MAMLKAESSVWVYDFDTRRVTPMPARELAPGMIRARVEGIEGEVWVDGAQAKPAPLRHPPFTGERLARVRRLWQALEGVSPKSLAAWEVGFRRDTNPDRELDIWDHIVRVFRKFTAGRRVPSGRKKDILHVVITASMNGPDAVRWTAERGSLSRGDARRIARHFWKTWMPPGHSRSEATGGAAPKTSLFRGGRFDPARLEELAAAEVIVALDQAGGGSFVVYGREAFDAAGEGGGGVEALFLLIDTTAGELEALLEAVTAVKGRHDFES